MNKPTIAKRYGKDLHCNVNGVTHGTDGCTIERCELVSSYSIFGEYIVTTRGDDIIFTVFLSGKRFADEQEVWRFLLQEYIKKQKAEIKRAERQIANARKFQNEITIKERTIK